MNKTGRTHAHLLPRLIQRIVSPFDRLHIPDRIIEEDFESIFKQCRRFTQTSVERMYALYKATQYIIDAQVPGSFVECGVWKGGSAMIMTKVILEREASDRTLYLYDTFQGMPKPSELDVTGGYEPAEPRWLRGLQSGRPWEMASSHEVEHNVLSTGFPANRLIMVKGRVEDTIPATVPDKIALLRLDTDWYESTRHELRHLYPLLETGGVLIIDDYGDWRGARKAVDEYFAGRGVLLNRIDNTGRLLVKITNPDLIPR